MIEYHKSKITQRQRVAIKLIIFILRPFEYDHKTNEMMEEIDVILKDGAR